MRNITGTHVSGDDFCGRVHEIKRCKQIVEHGNDILLLSPRRIGKSSLSAELGRQLHEDGWIYIRCDVQSAKKEEHFFFLLKQAIEKAQLQDNKTLKKAMGSIVGSLDKIKFSTTGVEVSTKDKTELSLWEESDALAHVLKDLADLPEKVLFVLDELPIFLKYLSKQDNGLERVANIFDWLNSTRENYTKEGFSWFLCGSIGIDSLTEQLGMPEKIQKYKHLSIGPMPREEAELLVTKLNINPEYFSEQKTEWISHLLNKINWLTPNYIQLLFSALHDIPLEARSDDFPAPSDLDIAYTEMTGKYYSSDFSHWDKRLGDAFVAPEDAIIARAALNHICHYSKGVEKDNVKVQVLVKHPKFNHEEFEDQWVSILRLLENDGYIYTDGCSIAFRSPVLRDYWVNKNS